MTKVTNPRNMIAVELTARQQVAYFVYLNQPIPDSLKYIQMTEAEQEQALQEALKKMERSTATKND